MTNIRTIRPAEQLPADLGASILSLTTLVWPPEPGAPTSDLAHTMARWKAQQSTHCIITSPTDANEVLAHALIFHREIFTPDGPLNVGALAGVCVHPYHRGNGWGAAVVRAAFDVLPELPASVSLFQTGVPHFYEKLGARLIPNRIFNGQTPDNPNDPFWEPHKVIYPTTFPWPDGDIDLNGPGY